MYNSDGYVLIDLTGVDITKTNQHLIGIYNRVLTVIDINKLALVINAGDLTPMAAVVHKKLNYYVINTPLYIFTINSNDIIMIEEAGEATVDVAIVPALLDGVKIADYTIGAVEGSLYAPEQQSEINDNITTDYTTWSSDKISTELEAKADTSDLATVATSGSYTDLSNTPTIPVLTDLIDDTTTSQDTVWSSDKTAAEIASGAGVTIDDTTTSLTKTWSSDKINSEVSAKPSINDTTASSSTVYSSDKVDAALSGKADNSDLGITTLSANDLFASGHYIDSFIAYKIGKIVFVQYISSSTMSYGNATDDYLAYFKSNSPYKPVNPVRYCFTTTRDSTIYRGECSPTGLFCRSFPQQGTFGQWAMSFFYEIA